MTSSPAEVWRAHIESASGRRCDLDVLLKDEWRHRVVARDDRAYGTLRQRVADLAGADYAALTSRVQDGASLGALVLAALHTALDSYGHGTVTVVAYSDLRGSAAPGSTSPGSTVPDPGAQNGSTTLVLPVVVDHQEQAQRSCAAAVAELDRRIGDADARLSSDEAFGRGLFDVALVLADREPTPAELPPVPLVATVHDVASEGRLRWTFGYAAELFDDAVIGGVLDVAREVLLQLVHHPDELVSDIHLLSDSQSEQLLRWNATEGDFPQEKRLNELFEECAARFPDAEAVVYRDARTTYAELDRRSNQLAHWLLGPEVGVTPKDLVALCLDKSDLGVVATLGIWKAGAAYVPIDPAYPADRIRFTLGDTRPAGVITNARHAARIRELLGDEYASVPVIEIEEVLGAGGGADRMPAHKPELGLDSSQLAYVTYTSGTTGVPKGVPKEHRSVVNSITDLSQRYDMLRPGTERVALYASYVFEPHLRQTLIALINGQTLVVVPDELRLDPDLFPAYLAEHGVTYLNATGSLLAHFDLSRCPELKRLLLVGEELTTAGLRRLREHFDGHIVNEYAFTESAFVTAVKEFAPGVSERTDRSIGRPLRNVTWYVLSQNLKQLPVGAIGELYIGGCGVAPGYLNREELTRGAFFANPYQSDEDRRRGQNERIYRTGDLARMLPNGEVEYLGRADFQLKINGVRIEPGEIEARATEYPGVRKCVVLAREATGGNGERYLVGYYVADQAVTIAESDLLDFLAERLIHVMVPARMVRLEQFPVNINGKVDWRALPEPEAQEGPRGEHAGAESIGAGGATDGSESTGATADDGLLDGIRRIWSAVLGVPVHRIAADDDFFRSGGQSISCILLVARIRRELHRDIAVEDVFRLRTPARLAARLAARPEHTDVAAPLPEDEADGAGEVRLLANGLQQGLLYHSMKSQDGDDAYVVQSAMRYRTALDPELMREAWRHAQRKYPSLRLRFEPGQESFQVIGAEDAPLDWRPVDLSDIAEAEEQEAEIQRIQERDRAERYRPTEGGLFRVYLIRQRDDLYTVVFSCHHIIIDGWGLPVVHDEVHRAYLDLLDGVPLSTAVDRAYVPAQRYWQEHRNDHVEYWTGQIERIEERGDLAGLLNERSRYKVSLGSYDHVREHRSRKLRLGAELTAALTAACSAHQVTLHSMLQFVWHRTLHAIGGGRTTVVGTIVSGRDIPVDGIEDSVGLYINTLPLVVDHGTQGGQSVAEAVADIQTAVNVMNSKSVVEVGRLDSGAMKRQLFDSLLVLENYPRLLDADEERRHRERLRFEKDFDADRVDQPLALVGREEGDELTVTLWYAGELFDDSAVDTLLETARTLFEQVATDPTRPVTELEYLSESMAAELESRNRTETDFPGDRTLHAVFEEAAAAWPDAPALVFRDVHLSYRELNERANRLAHHLLSLAPLAADDLVALVVDKSELMIIAILAVWKTGAGYVPIDPQFPDDRIDFMLGDTSAKLVLTNDAHADRLRALGGTSTGSEPRPVLALESLDLSGLPTHNPVTATTSTDLAYAIYTSGTTGRPKAVLLEHRGVVNLQVSLAKLFGLSKADGDEALLSFSNYVFDHFVEQMTDALLNGQKLVVLDDALRTDAAGLCRYIDDNEVTYLSGTPSVLSLYDFSPTTSLRRIDAIGEDFSEPVFAKIRDGFDGLIINGYGPTEISITSHKRLYGPAEPRLDKSIGFPVANTACYVLNSAMKRVPVGGVGELYIGGDGVARGYLNRPDLTAERFLDNPFQTAQERARGYNARMYRTGDLCRWLPNGEIEYLGRTDLQVKIRGQRVELGEIESVLASVPGVTRALVVAREHRATGASVASQKYLVGFYIGARELPEQDVKEAMRQRLSEALVPTRIIRIADIPVTPSGKLDVKRLPETDFAPEDSVAYVAPASDVEIRVCRIWAQVLGVEPNLIGANDDFFALGGDSIRAMALAQAVTSAFGGGFGVAAVFRNTTLAAQARYIQDAVSASTPQDADALGAAGLAERRAGRPPVSLAQERLLFIDEFEGGTAAYNIPFTLRIPLGQAASAQSVSAPTVEAALHVLVGRHAALRTLIQVDPEGARCQQVLPATEAAALFSLPSQQLDGHAQLDRELVADAGYVFRLDAELPLRARLYRLGAATDELWLSLVFHHTCLDGWSWDVFRSELVALLGGGSEAGLPALRASYADFAVWQRQFLTGRQLTELTDYWTGALAGFEPVRLPLDRPRPARFDYRGREVPFTLDARTTEELRALARSARVSLYSVLLGAWCLMLAAYSGQDDLVVGTPSANRGRPEFAGVVGFMANLLAVRVGVDRGVSLTDYLRAVGAAVVAAQVHGELPFEQLVKELGVGQDPSRHPVVQVNFTLMQGGGSGPESDGGVALTEYQPDAGGWTSVKFDLSAILYEKPDGISGLVTYAASLFEDAGVDSFLAAFHRVLAEFVRLAPQAGTVRVAELAWVDDEPGVADLATPASAPETAGTETVESETAGTAAAGAVPVVAGDGPHTLHALFERVAAERPDAVAVVCGQRRLTYRELDERANRLAHQLRATVPLTSGDMIALVLDKSELTVVAVLATWKAGAGYLPIDPGYPDDRIAFMLADTGARLVLANEAHRDRLSGLLGDERVPVLGMEWLPLDGRPSDSPVVGASGTDPAYAIYTSGTTGRPKAVRVPHRAALGFHAALQGRYFEAGVDQGVLYLANYVFDFSVEQFMLGVLSGNTLIVPPPVLDDAFLDAAGREGLSYVSGTPTQITQIDLGRLPALRAVLVAGEAFLPHHFEKIRREFQGPLFNAYGTTETTVYNTVRPFAPGEEYRNDLGAALPNTRLYVLDDAMRPLPPGAAGELYLAGECVTDGYLNRPELTAERFLPNHLRTAADRDAGRFPVLYRTGDVVRRRADGELRYLGRNDSQVKIRGVRIELGEVEAAIAACPGVRESAVVVRDDERSPGARRLVGYYVPEAAATEAATPEAGATEAGATVDDEQVLAALRATLMPSMVPSLLVRLDGPLPMTINGKVDTAALPDVEFSAHRTRYVAPRSRTEARLCRLWAEQLPTGVVGIDDDFFRSGGDSISALRLASRIQRATGRPVSVKDVFDHPTVRALAEQVLSRRTVDADESARALAVGEQGRLTGDSPMLPIQRWFFNKPVADRARWNQNFAVRTPALDPDRLRTALAALLDHHDAFFLRFRNLDGDAVDVEQFYAADRPAVVLHEVDVRQVGEQGLGEQELREQLDRLQGGFDLEHGPVFTVGHLHGYQDGSARVWFAPHHLVVDVVSWRILAQDLEILYHGGTLGPKGASYRQWAQAVARYRPVDGEAELWARTAREVADERASALPADGRRSSNREEFTLDREETEELLTESSWAYDTDINDLLLTAVGYALRTVTGRSRNHVTVEGHGREQFDGAPDVRDTVGWFTTMHPVPVEADPDLGRAIGATRANRRRVPHHGLGYGALRGLYGGTGAPLPPVSFNYLGRLADQGAESTPDAAGREPWRLDSAAWAGAPIGGEGASDSVLDITMSCIDGRLVTVVDSKLDDAVTRGFAEELSARLRELIRHTVAVARTRAGRGAGRGDGVQDAFVPHIQVNEEAEGRPLFLLPPGEGGAESYLGNIAGRLPGTRLVLFNNLHLHTPGESFEALAEYYLEEIRRIQPQGPYRLLGWSFGGVLATEMALQLVRSGEQVEHLFLIDPYYNVRRAVADAGLPELPELLDPINYRYAPGKEDLDRLAAAIGELVLFKAGEPNEITTGPDQNRLFEHYLRSDHNYLDTLLPGHLIRLETLTGQTHHSWVKDPALVATMGRTIAGLLSGTSDHTHSTEVS